VPGGPDLFVICKSCGSEVSPYITECPYCGARLRKRAPKLDRRFGAPVERSRRPQVPSLPRLRRGEIPGIRVDARPYATIALVLASVAVTLVWRAGGVQLSDLAVTGALVASNWWHVLTAPFAHSGGGYQFAALIAVALFGTLLERRHSGVVVVLLFLAGGAGGMALTSAIAADRIAQGANGAALALLCAWAIPDLIDRQRGHEIEGDLLGVAVIAGVLLAMPLATDEASPIAGLGGAIAGLVLGLPLARFSRAR